MELCSELPILPWRPDLAWCEVCASQCGSCPACLIPSKALSHMLCLVLFPPGFLESWPTMLGVLCSAGPHGWACGGKSGTGGIILLLVHFYLHFMHLCFLAWGVYRSEALLCLVSSLIQHSWAASFQLVVCVAVSWFRGLLGAGDVWVVYWWCGILVDSLCHLLLEVFSALDTLHLCSYNIYQ